ncbi:hypothetical protein LD85_3113 [Saccharolobus islandicus L.D.8.5]|uniref:Uncharacterized protein n=1 Tax=Saccharolobus islandicus (strain L.D.8.5 / Lassen \|nr:hypothetical protein LD85_3113 [Sulfolobus islandicus L.D.8.5]
MPSLLRKTQLKFSNVKWLWKNYNVSKDSLVYVDEISRGVNV